MLYIQYTYILLYVNINIFMQYTYIDRVYRLRGKSLASNGRVLWQVDNRNGLATWRGRGAGRGKDGKDQQCGV